MHEFSTVKKLLNQAIKEAEKKDVDEITKIWMEIGELKFISKESAETAFKTLSQGTIAENADLEVEIVPSKIKCKECGYEGEAEVPENVPHTLNPEELGCPECGGEIKIIQGKKASVKKFKGKKQ